MKRKNRKPERLIAEGPFTRFFDSLGIRRPSGQERNAFDAEFSKEWPKVQNKPEKERDFWNRMAQRWHKSYPLDITNHEVQLVSEYGNFNPDDKVASIGSAIALQESFIAKEVVPQGKVVCIDYIEAMGRQALDTKSRAQAHNLSVVMATGNRIPLPNNSMDKVIALRTTFPGTKDWQPFLHEARRVLKKTGGQG